MKITLSNSAPPQVETECLVVAVVDASEKSDTPATDKPKPQILSDDAAVKAAASDLIASGEVTGKAMESTLLHKPAGLKAKRLLLIGGGKAKSFAASDVRKIAGAALRAIKGKDLKSFAIVAPATLGISAAEA